MVKELLDWMERLLGRLGRVAVQIVDGPPSPLGPRVRDQQRTLIIGLDHGHDDDGWQACRRLDGNARFGWERIGRSPVAHIGEQIDHIGGGYHGHRHAQPRDCQRPEALLRARAGAHLPRHRYEGSLALGNESARRTRIVVEIVPVFSVAEKRGEIEVLILQRMHELVGNHLVVF